MKEANRKDSARYLFLGLVMAELGMLLIGLGGWNALYFQTRMLNYAGGSILFLSGLVLIWIDARRMKVACNGSGLTSEGTYLGKFELNGHLFEAYERRANNGASEFRLLSSPSVNPAQEAAFIRYLVNEGLIEAMWPNMSRQIEEEANWAFL
ncbi:MAG: hypothetical protein JO232_01340 [Verrucomicrobia bacterium]|nr:hypothetical protein [Verrucomicrobiota bacterium]